MASGKTGSMRGYLFLFIILIVSLVYLRKYNVEQRKVQIFDSMLGQFVETNEGDAFDRGESTDVLKPADDIVVPPLEDIKDRVDNKVENIGGSDLADEIDEATKGMCMIFPDETLGCRGGYELDENSVRTDEDGVVTFAGCCRPVGTDPDTISTADMVGQFALELGIGLIVGNIIEVGISKALGKKLFAETAEELAERLAKEAAGEAVEEVGETAAQKAARLAAGEVVEEVGETAAQKLRD